MDYTPGAFRNVTREEFEPRMESPVVMGTRAQQLAMYAIYQAAIQMVSDAPQAYAGEPEFEFIRAVPATWDETRVVGGPGEFVPLRAVTARNGFLAASPIGTRANWILLSASWERGIIRRRSIPMHRMLTCTPRTSELRPKPSRGFAFTAKLAPAGGYAVRFVPTP